MERDGWELTVLLEREHTKRGTRETAIVVVGYREG